MPRRTTNPSIGNTRGGRGRLPANIRTMADYYNSGRASALATGANIRRQGSNRVLNDGTLRGTGSC